MSRLRYTDVIGTIGSGNLTNSATSHTFTAPLTYGNGSTVPTLGTGESFLLSVLTSAGLVREVFLVKAYDSSTGAAATIVRGQEGTTGQAHTSGDKVTLDAYPSDLVGPSIDNLAAYNDVFGVGYTGHDQEFNASSSTSLPSGWSWQNQGTATYRERFGAGVLITQANTANWRSILQSLSGAPSTFVLHAKLTVSPTWATAVNEFGIVLTDGTIHRVFEHVFGAPETGHVARIANWSTATTFGSVVNSTSVNTSSGSLYFRVTKNSATSFDYAISSDGRAWASIVAGYNPATAGAITPTHIGIGIVNGNSTIATELAVEWWRLR